MGFIQQRGLGIPVAEVVSRSTSPGGESQWVTVFFFVISGVLGCFSTRKNGDLRIAAKPGPEFESVPKKGLDNHRHTGVGADHKGHRSMRNTVEWLDEWIPCFKNHLELVPFCWLNLRVLQRPFLRSQVWLVKSQWGWDSGSINMFKISQWSFQHMHPTLSYEDAFARFNPRLLH